MLEDASHGMAKLQAKKRGRKFEEDSLKIRTTTF